MTFAFGVVSCRCCGDQSKTLRKLGALLTFKDFLLEKMIQTDPNMTLVFKNGTIRRCMLQFGDKRLWIG